MKNNMKSLFFVCIIFFSALYGCKPRCNKSQCTSATPSTVKLISISISALETTTIDVLDSTQFTAVGTYENGLTTDITDAVQWLSSNSRIATVQSGSTDAGKVDGVFEGTVGISATLDDVMSPTISIIVVPTLVSVFLDPISTKLIETGQTQQYVLFGKYIGTSTSIQPLTSVFWSSSDTSAASIDSSGLATGSAIAGGTVKNATITACYPASSFPSCAYTTSADLQVQNSLVSIFISTSSSTNINVLDTIQFTAMGTYYDGSIQTITNLVEWISSDTAKVIVQSNGSTAGLAQGVFETSSAVHISATLDGITSSSPSSISVSVSPKLVSIFLTSNTNLINPNDLLQYTLYGTYIGATTSTQIILAASASWYSSESFVVFNTPGQATAALPTETKNNTTITACYPQSAYPCTGFTATANLIVTSPITITPGNLAISVSTDLTADPIQYTATTQLSSGYTIDVTTLSTWSSSNTNIVTIDSTNGLITGILGTGIVTISATYGTYVASTTLTVTNFLYLSVVGTSSISSTSIWRCPLQPDGSDLLPKVGGIGGTACESFAQRGDLTGAAANTVGIFLDTEYKYLYATQEGASVNRVYSCPFLYATGMRNGTCSPITSSMNIRTAGVTILSGTQTLYYSNFPDNVFGFCNLNRATGSASGCTAMTNNPSFNGSVPRIFNLSSIPPMSWLPTQALFYALGTGNHVIYLCPNNLSTLSPPIGTATCFVAYIGGASLNSMGFNPSFNKAYVTDYSTVIYTFCVNTAPDGQTNICNSGAPTKTGNLTFQSTISANFGVASPGANGISVNPNGNYLYVFAQNNALMNICSISATTGDINTCTPSAYNGTFFNNTYTATPVSSVVY